MSNLFATSSGYSLLPPLLVIAGCLLVIVGYFAPIIIAIGRGLPNTGKIAAVNVFLGWSTIGWIVALVMSLQKNPYRTQPMYVAPQKVPPPPGWYPDEEGSLHMR
jgi:hypothetical protein